MKEPAKREVKWELGSGFRDSWKKYLKVHPEIKAAMTEFDTCKRAVPPRQLPGKMHDHKLNGLLKGFMDCHLADDVILIYKPLANGGIKLFSLCDHSDMKGPKAKALRNRLK